VAFDHSGSILPLGSATRFPPKVICHVVWLYFRFTMSLRDVEDLLAERRVVVTYEAVHCWANKFGPVIAANIRRRRGRAACMWHLDEMVVRIAGKRMWMWRAVDKEDEVLDVLALKRSNRTAAIKLPKKLRRNQGFVPEWIVTGGLPSYKAAMRELGCKDQHSPGRLRDNNRVENSHLSLRRHKWKIQRFISTYSAIYNTFNIQRHLLSRNTMRQFRSAAMAEWDTATTLNG